MYRLEILAAFVNALLLFGVAIYVLVEAVDRLRGDPEVLGLPMLVVAVLGLLVNLVAFAMLRQGAKESLNVEGAYLEVLADTLGRSEEHTSELQSLMRISYAVFCLTKKTN